MTTTYSLQPDPQWRFFTLTGEIASGCKMYTYQAANHAVAKTIYQDPDGDTPWPNPVVFDSTGASGPFYWADDEPYYIVIEDANGNVLWTEDDFPTNAENFPVQETANGTNYIQNAQFRLFPVQSYSSPVPSSISALAFGGWSFSKTNTTATDTLSFQRFILGQTTVPNNPVYYLNYACTGAGSGETTKDIIYTIPDVGTFSNQEINLQLEGQSSTSSSIEILVNQHFGTGGSPSSDVTTSIATIALTPTFAGITPQVFTPPSVAGKTLGTNGDDSFQLIFRMPLNTTCNVSLALPDLQMGATAFTTQEVTEQQSAIQTIGTSYPTINTVNPLDGYYDVVLPQGSFNLSFIARAGKMITWPVNTAPDYALLCNGLMYFSNDYYNLANICFDSSQTAQYTVGQLAWGTGLAGFVADLADAVTCTNNANGLVTAGQDVNSGYGVVQTVAGSSSVPAVAVVFCRTGADTPNSSYFYISSAATNFYVWFNLNATGVNPAPAGRTAIEIAYTGSETAAQMAALLVAAINTGITTTLNTNCIQGTCFSDGAVTSISDNNTGLKVVQIESGGASDAAIAGIVAVAGSSIVNGSWLLVSAPTQGYYLWFSQNNKTYDPGSNQTSLSGKKGIKVVYTGSETAAQMADLIAIQWAVAQFRVPDVRGLTPRYWSAGAGAVLPYAAQLIFTFLGNDAAVNFDITGLDENGNVISETLAGANMSTSTSVNSYAAVTNIQPDAVTNAAGMYVGVEDAAYIPQPTECTLTSTGNNSAVNFVFVGTDYQGNPQTDTIAGPNNNTVSTSVLFSSIESVTPDDNTVADVQIGTTFDAQNDSIGKLQAGTINTALVLDGIYSAINGVASLQQGSDLSPLILDGIYGRDPDYYARIALYTNLNGTIKSATGDNTGSFQFDNYISHSHFGYDGLQFYTDGASTPALQGGATTGDVHKTTDNSGGNETRSQNIQLNMIIYF